MTDNPYEAPALVELGSVSELTQAASAGNALDQSFPTNTPFQDLTFS